MTDSIFVQFDGIDGSSIADKHDKWCEIMSMGHGHASPGQVTSTGLGAGRVSMQEYSFVKELDKASTKLQLYCADGTHIPKVTIHVVKQGGDMLNFVEIILSDCLVSSYSASYSGGGIPSENVSVLFKKVEYKYFGQGNDGKTKPDGQWGWDVAINKKV